MRQITRAMAVCLSLVVGEAIANSAIGSHLVRSVTVHNSGHVLVVLDNNSNTEGCATPSLQNYILLHKTNPNFKLMYASAMLALSTDRPLSGNVDGCTDIWSNGASIVTTAISLAVER
jgi:hypothetical protein